MPGVAQLGDWLAFGDLVPWFDQQAGLDEMRVEGVGAVADIEHDVVAIHVVHGQLRPEHWILGRQQAWGVGVLSIQDAGDRAVGDCDDL